MDEKIELDHFSTATELWQIFAMTAPTE